MSDLFSPLTLRSVSFRNRVFVSPMCQYSCTDGLPNDWHLVHLGSRAVGGAGLVMVEATGVSAEGRISPGDMGLWSTRHAELFRRVTDFVHAQGAVAGVQLAHAGRKASTHVPWKQAGAALTSDEGAWVTLAPSALPFSPKHPAPKAMTLADCDRVKNEFREAARLALAAGFRVIELHMAHGYLLNEFLSPLSNHRSDGYGGDAEGRMRFPLDVTHAVRDVWPAELPLFVRISATDWTEGGWTADDAVRFSARLKDAGVDLVDCSSGGLVWNAHVPVGPGYQVPFAQRVRAEAHVATGAVGLITEAQQAQDIVSSEKADAVFLARAMLRDPYWPLHAAQQLRVDVPWPLQYLRAKP